MGERARYDAARSGGPVDESTFRAQLQHFTWGLFADWDAELWENVLLAGGAVLGSLLPAPPDYKDLRPLDGNGGASWCEFDLYSSFSSSCNALHIASIPFRVSTTLKPTRRGIPYAIN